MKRSKMDRMGCESCGSYVATTRRGTHGTMLRMGCEVPSRVALCAGCAHMVDEHGAGPWDAYMPDPCDEQGRASA